MIGRTDMQELKEILKEIEQRKARAEKLIVKPPHDKLDQVANDTAEAFIEAYKECQDIIRKHMNDGERFEFDFTDVKSFACQCGRHYVNIGAENNDGWISVEEQLPEVGDYVLGTNKYGEVLVYHYGWNDPHSKKMFFHLCGAAANVIAWRPLPELYRPERSEGE